MKLNCTILLQDLIYQPYTDARADVIDIRKKSGADRARSETKRQLCLEQELSKEGMTWPEWLALNVEANQLWQSDENSVPLIPRHWLSGMLVAGILKLPKAARYGLTPENLRTNVRILQTWRVTEQTEVAQFTRAIKNDNSNQRRVQTDRVFEGVRIEGRLEVPDPAHPETEESALENYQRILTYCLHECGLGGARKMGYGRGKVVSLVVED